MLVNTGAGTSTGTLPPRGGSLVAILSRIRCVTELTVTSPGGAAKSKNNNKENKNEEEGKQSFAHVPFLLRKLYHISGGRYLVLASVSGRYQA